MTPISRAVNTAPFKRASDAGVDRSGQYASGYYRKLVAIVWLLPWLALSACQGDVGSVVAKGDKNRPMLDDDSEAAGVLVQDWRFVSASAAGDKIDLQVDYRVAVNPEDFDAARLDLQLAVHAVDDDEQLTLLGETRTEITADSLSGQGVVIVRSEGLDWRLQLNVIHPVTRQTLATTSLDLPVEQTGRTAGKPTQVTQLALQRVGSYVSTISNGRRLHSFSVRVADTDAWTLDNENLLYEQGQGIQFVAGLEQDPQAHFRVLEQFNFDVESALSVAVNRNRVVLHLLLDGSSSIRANGHEAALRHIAAATVAQLQSGDSALVDAIRYEQFSQNSRRINSLRDYQVDTIPSGTALYYSMDRTLAWIRENSHPTDYNVMVVFTDGRDLASPNFYDGQSQEQIARRILEQIVQSAENLQSHPDNTGGAGLEVHLVTLNEPSAFMAGGEQERYFKEWQADSLDDVAAAFKAISNRISGTYQLLYNSQITVGEPQLQVQVRFTNPDGQVIENTLEIGDQQ